jgi:hypothetical protein
MTDEQIGMAALLGILLMLFLLLAASIAYAAVFIVRLNRLMGETPAEAAAHCGAPIAPEKIRSVHQQTLDEPPNWRSKLPKKQDRRYIIVGGSGTTTRLIKTWQSC